MLKFAAFLAEFKMKLIIGGILCAVVAGGWFAWDARGNKIEKLQGEAVIAKVAVGGLVKTVETQKGAALITEAINTAITVDAEKIVVRQDKVTAKRQKAVADIEKIFDALPPTSDNIQERDTQTSKALINGLWDTYCTGMPNATSCTAST